MSDQDSVQSREGQPRTHTFNPNEHLIQLKSKAGSQDYLPVQWRLVWFREKYPHGTIDTEELEVDLDREVEAEAFVWNPEKRRSEKVVKRAKGYARYKAVVTDGKGGRGTGTKSENAANFPDYVEKAETGAIGRALAALGYGTQFTGDEWNEAHRIVDSPVDFGNNGSGSVNNASGAAPHSENGNGAQAAAAENASATDQQLASIRKLCEHLGKSEPENVTSISYLAARRLIQQLTAEYREYRQSNKAS
jgi:hypothetical protein